LPVPTPPDWSGNHDGLNLLVVHYEDLIADLEGEVRKVTQFCGMPIPEARVADILRHCSFEYMQHHNARFAPEYIRPRCGPSIKFIRFRLAAATRDA